MFQSVTVMGYLGGDPEMRYTANGSAVATFSIAASRVFNDAAGERREVTTWFRCVAWNRTAEIAAQYLQKGRLALVEGRIETRTYEKTDGSKGYSWELVVGRLVLMPDTRRERSYGGAGENDRPQGGFSSPGFATGPDDIGDIDPDDLPF